MPDKLSDFFGWGKKEVGELHFQVHLTRRSWHIVPEIIPTVFQSEFLRNLEINPGNRDYLYSRAVVYAGEKGFLDGVIVVNRVAW